MTAVTYDAENDAWHISFVDADFESWDQVRINLAPLFEFAEITFSVSKHPDSFDCPVCLESYTSTEAVVTNCHHVFCFQCIKNHLSSFCEPCCSLCRAPYTHLKMSTQKQCDEMKA
jgi:hypothetical protein